MKGDKARAAIETAKSVLPKIAEDLAKIDSLVDEAQRFGDRAA
jgi:hypothetical protein